MRNHRSIVLLALLAVSLWALPAQAQKNKKSVLLTLKNGESVEGLLLKTKKGKIQFKTWLGLRTIPEKSVIARRDASKLKTKYRTELNKINADKVEDHVKLARWCLSQGFTSGFAAELDAILRRDPDNKFAWGMITRMAPVYRLAKKNTHSPTKPRWARKESDLLYAAAKNQSFMGAAMIRAQLDALPDDANQLNNAVKYADKGSEPQRWIAVHMLGQSNKVRRVKPLYRRALGDPSWQVRAGAVASLKKHDDGTTIGPFERALFHGKYATTRSYAAQALGMLGDKRAVKPLLAAYAASGSGGSPRNHIRISRQQSYVKDFDVEIAQAAVIADPIIDTVEEGVVLDVAVVSVGIQRRRINASLHQLTGVGKSFSSKDWESWWKKNKGSYPSR